MKRTKKDLIKRLNYYYPMERMHAFLTFPLIVIYLISINSILDIVFLLYGLILCISILYQGQHYWKLKLNRITKKAFDQDKNLEFFRKSKRINLIMIALIPLIFVVQLYLADWKFKTDNLMFWGWMPNIFGILEHI